MARRTKVGLIFGGRSGEHEVSLRSAHAVIHGVDRKKYSILPIAIDREGRWLSPTEAAALLPPKAAALLETQEINEANQGIAILEDTSRPALVSASSQGNRKSGPTIDIAFPVLHGTFGEDGTIQGLLEIAGVPYVGCGVLASSSGMDKVAMKALFHHAGLPMCNYSWFLRTEWDSKPRSVLDRIARQVGFPCFVKPANLGSSVGITRATERTSLERAIDLAASYDRKIIVEEGLDVREIECAVIGNDEPEASLPGEYVVLNDSAKFLDYTEKYANTGHVQFVVPAPLSRRLTRQIQEMAKRAFKAIDGAGLARVDFFLRRDTKELLINEVNTLPGLTDVSGFPKMWAASGVPFSKMLDRLIGLGFERHRDKSRNKTSL